MPAVNKIDTYNSLARATAKRLAHGREWMQFLRTAGRVYKYPYTSQMLIYAQKPEAKACAEFDVWKKRMGRYVRGGSKGIALVRKSRNGVASIHYVFDIADTGAGKGARRPFLWQYQQEHRAAVAEALEKCFAVSADETLAGQVVRIAVQLADSHWQDFGCNITQDSMMGDCDEDNLRLIFRNAIISSVSYAVLSRCGVDLGELFAEEDFQCLVGFDSNEAITALGNAVNAIAGEVLRTIEDAIRKYELKKLLAITDGKQTAHAPQPTEKEPETANAPTVANPAVSMDKAEPEPETPAQNNNFCHRLNFKCTKKVIYHIFQLWFAWLP